MFFKVLMSIFFLVLSGMSEIGKKNLNNNDQYEENADFGHFRPFLPKMAQNGRKLTPNLKKCAN